MPYYANPNPGEIQPDQEYNLRALATIFDCQPGALRAAIKKGELKAKRRSRTFVVRGVDALGWWNNEFEYVEE